MYREFDQAKLERRLEKVSSRSALLFGLLTVDRMIPNYLRFATEVGAAGGAFLEETVLSIWRHLEVQSSDTALHLSPADCEMLVPESETFDSLYTASAADAAVATANLIEFATSQKTKLIAEVGSLSRDTVDMFLQYTAEVALSSPDFERTVKNHPLMQRELEMQSDDLELVSQQAFETVQSLAGLRLRLRERGSVGMVPKST